MGYDSMTMTMAGGVGARNLEHICCFFWRTLGISDLHCGSFLSNAL